MLYGFGDVPNPRQDTVDLVEECLLYYLGNVLDASIALASKRAPIASSGNTRLKTEDVLTVLKRDPRKYGRAEELLYMNAELKRVTRAFDTEEPQ
jgi:transcription initiation factor TFIID subunit 13